MLLLRKHAILAGLLVLCSGCISIDPKISEQSRISTINKNLDIWVRDISKHRSEKGPDRLTDAMGINVGFVSLIHIKRQSEDHLIMKFFQLRETVFEKKYELGKDFRQDSNGDIRISNESTCDSQDSIVIGCLGSRIRMFENEDGDLAAVYSSTGGGLIGIFPAAAHVTSLLVLPNVGRDPDHAP